MAVTGMGGCKSDDEPGVSKPRPDDGEDDDDDETGGTGGGETGTGGGDTGSGDTGTGEDSGTDGGDPTNCGDLVCRGHGKCEIDGGVATCVCDEGYILDPTDDTRCIVDESCVQVRFLENHCRQVVNGVPAVALFFAVDFCSGTAVLPDKFEELGLEYRIFEQEEDITGNVESSHQIVPADVESYVTLAVDASDSVIGSQDFPLLVAQLRDLVTGLAVEPGEPPVHVSVHMFGRRVRKLIEFTTDLDEVDVQLAALAQDPKAVLDSISGPAGWNGMGTAVYPAVVEAIHEMDRAVYFRDVVTAGGVLTTGTIVVVTDANDTSNTVRPDTLIEQTVNQMISVGISTEITDEDLDAIGRDGSFLTPETADWAQAFQEITQRVKEYPERAYLLAYCSSILSGEAEVVVTLEGKGITVTNGAGCRFDADAFGSDPPVCTGEFFDTECNTASCGGLTGCGACANDQCCVGGQCVAPSSLSTCNGVDHMCRPGDGICLGEGTEEEPWYCGPGAAVGSECGGPDDLPCAPAESYCYEDETETNPDTCVAVVSEGGACEESVECETLNCERTNPENPFDPKICQPEARAFDTCGPQKATCERGTYCSSTCRPKHWWAQSCSNHGQCISGYCHEDARACVGTGICSITWDEALGR